MKAHLHDAGLLNRLLHQATDESINGWNRTSVRPEIAPEFSHFGSDMGELILGLSGQERETVDGAWIKVFDVLGGRAVRFRALKRTQHVNSPARCALVKITWLNANGKMLKAAEVHGNLVLGKSEIARPEYPSYHVKRSKPA